MNCKIHPESYDDIIERNWPEGIKKTHQRVDILRIFLKEETPVSAAEIYKQLNENHPTEMYAFSTIYRNLIAFEKAGVITKTVSNTEETAVYELKNGKHKHYIVCLKCHKRIPINSCPIDHIVNDIKEYIPGFKITGHSLEIYGYCADCKDKE